MKNNLFNTENPKTDLESLNSDIGSYLEKGVLPPIEIIKKYHEVNPKIVDFIFDTILKRQQSNFKNRLFELQNSKKEIRRKYTLKFIRLFLTCLMVFLLSIIIVKSVMEGYMFIAYSLGLCILSILLALYFLNKTRLKNDKSLKG